MSTTISGANYLSNLPQNKRTSFIDRESSEANRGRKRRNFPSGAVFAAHGGNGAVRGISEPADKPISHVYDGYYHQLNSNV